MRLRIHFLGSRTGLLSRTGTSLRASPRLVKFSTDPVSLTISSLSWRNALLSFIERPLTHSELFLKRTSALLERIQPMLRDFADDMDFQGFAQFV